MVNFLPKPERNVNVPVGIFSIYYKYC